MRLLDDVVLNRRQMIALGLGSVAAFGLAACSSSNSASTSSDATATGETKEEAASSLDATAFDALMAKGATAPADVIAASAWATKVKDGGKLRVGGVESDALFGQKDPSDGEMRGFDAGLYRLLARYIFGDDKAYSNPVTKVTTPTRESVLQRDQVDAVFATYSITEERQKFISFAGPYFSTKLGIMVKKDNTSINGVEDLAGKTVGVQTGSSAIKALEKYAPEAKQEAQDTDQQLRTSLDQGRIDAYVVDVTIINGSLAKNPDKYRLAGEFGDPDNYGIGLPLDSDGVAFVNTFLKEIEDAGLWTELYKLCIANIDNVPQPPAIGA